MIITNKYRHQLVGIIGLGKTGLATIHSLLAGGATVMAWDDSPTCSQTLIAEVIVNPSLDNIKSLKAVVISPGIAIDSKHPVVQQCLLHNIPIESDLAMLIKACSQATHIGITGTNGKSTTTALLGHIIKHSDKKVEVGGNIGIAALSLQPLDENGFYVIEASSFQLERFYKAKFNTAILLNITPDHLDRYASIEEYTQAKLHIFDNQTASDFAIICVDCKIANQAYLKLSQTSAATIIPISTQNKLSYGASLLQNTIYINLHNEEISYPLGELTNLVGNHNMQNILAAFTAAFVNGITPEAIISAIHSFQGLKHRMQLVCERNGLKFINDSKATNADSCVKALETYDDIYWIAGGICKDDGIDGLNHTFHKIKHAYLIGKAAHQFAAVLDKYNVAYTKSNTLEESFRLLKELNPAGGVVLLSPSCSSFDQWKNFEERGDAFCQLALDWK